jgi:hypothetical protein
LKRDRDSETLDSDPADQPLKKTRNCLTFFDDEDMDRLRGEISGIKERIRNLDVLLGDH